MMRSLSSSYRIPSCHLLTSPGSGQKKRMLTFLTSLQEDVSKCSVEKLASREEEMESSKWHTPSFRRQQGQRSLTSLSASAYHDSGTLSFTSLFPYVWPGEGSLIKKKKKPMFRQRGYQMWLWDLSTSSRKGLHKGGFSSFINLAISASLLPCSSVSH